MSRKIITTAILLTATCSIGWSQVNLNVDIHGPSPGNCDGMIKVSYEGPIGEVSGVHHFGQTSDFEVSQDTAILSGACSGNYYATAFGLGTDSCSLIVVGSFFSEVGGYSTLVESENRSFTIVFNFPTTEFSADGSIAVVSNDLGDVDIMYVETPSMEGAVSIGVLTSDQDTVGTGTEVQGLNAGEYMVVFKQNLFPGIAFSRFGIRLEPLVALGCEDVINVTPVISFATHNDTCNGSVEIFAYGTYGPYSYAHSTGDQSSLAENLCSGLYWVEVEDGMDNSVTVPYLIPVDGNVVNSINWPYDPTLDTLFTIASENCYINFNEPIDSVSIVEMIILDSLQCQGVWLVYQDSAVFTFTAEYSYQGMDPYVFSIGVFCENGRSELGYYYLFDEFDMNDAGFVGVRETENVLSTDFSVHPNPSNGFFNVTTSTSETMNIIVFDLFGRAILSQQVEGQRQYRIDLSDCVDGIYFIQIETANGRAAKRLMKN